MDTTSSSGLSYTIGKISVMESYFSTFISIIIRAIEVTGSCKGDDLEQISLHRGIEGVPLRRGGVARVEGEALASPLANIGQTKQSNRNKGRRVSVRYVPGAARASAKCTL